MIRAGVPTRTAKSISGHKTDSTFYRYGIISDADQRRAIRARAEFCEKEKSTVPSTTVVQ